MFTSIRFYHSTYQTTVQINTVRAHRKSYNKSTVDDSVISTFQQKLIDTLNDYNHEYIMNSHQTRIQQSMPPVYTIHQAGKPAVVNIGVNTNPDQMLHLSCVPRIISLLSLFHLILLHGYNLVMC